jgi:hypothetical protein
VNPMLISNCNTDRKRVIRLQGKVIGVIEGNTFSKSVRGSKHQLKHPPAWAIDAVVFDNEIKPNCARILITDKGTNTRYQVSVSNFDRHKVGIERGFGKQYYLPLPYWESRKDDVFQLKLWELSNG